MATARKATAKTTSSTSKVADAVALLTADHKEAKQFKEYDKLAESNAAEA